MENAYVMLRVVSAQAILADWDGVGGEGFIER